MQYVVITYSDTIPPRTPKIRRRTAQPQDLLFGDSASSDQMTRSYQQQHSHQPQNDSNRSNFIPLARVPSAPGSLK